MSLKFFITGTDTNVGKTYISLGIVKKFNTLGFKVMGLKPIATGGIIKDEIIYNDDALLLQKHSSVVQDYSSINPFCFSLPVSPNIAAKLANFDLSIDKIYKKLCKTLNNEVDVFIIEGAGGWQVPFNDQETMADLVAKLDIPVIIVVAIKLGCINHSILTYQSILSRNLSIAGWVANCLDPGTLKIQENIETIKQFIKTPCLGIIEFGQKPEEILDIIPLISRYHQKKIG